MRNFSLFLCLVCILFACKNQDELSHVNCEPGLLIDFVNPFIGTGGHGHTYPGATLPFGYVQLSPDTRLTGWDGCSGYHYTDSVIYGFSHTHLQGTGVSDYADILVMPTNNEIKSADNWSDRYSSSFKKSSEKASPGYYSVHLDDHGVTAELTATERVGIHKYTYDEQGDSCVIFMDMSHRDQLLEYSFYPLDDTTIVGHRVSKEWATEQYVYFVAVFDQPFIYNDQTYETTVSENMFNGEMEETMEFVPIFPLDFKWKKEVNMKVALSNSSVQSAIANLNAEAPHWDFEKYKSDAESAWNNELSRIEVSGGSKDELTTFYTSLYHSYTVPNVYSDVNNVYRGTDNQLYMDQTAKRYSVFSLWDTFRATHPLYCLTQQERTKDFMNGFVEMYHEGGQLPMWELANNYTGCMVGYHSVSAMADAYIKGIWEPASTDEMLKSMVQAADSIHLGKPEFADLGYIPSEMEHESVSKTLEYAYDDFCIAMAAKKAGNEVIYNRFIKRSLNYRNLYDSETQFFRPKLGAGWIENFDPREVNFNFTEANAWQYNFFVPQDVNGHIDLVGGDQAYIDLLNKLFSEESVITGRHQVDITGLIGQYAHGNEPSHHMAWLYHYAGQPWRSQEILDSIFVSQYRNAPNGLSGNEDCGQMSSWYVLSTLGLYSVTPGTDIYVLGAPLFDESILHFENGKSLLIRKEAKQGGRYIQNVTLNGVDVHTSYLTHEQIMNGGVLVVHLGSTISNWGTQKEYRPKQLIETDNFVAVPSIHLPRSFKGKTSVNMHSIDESASIHYQLDNQDWQVYSHPFEISESHTIKSYAQLGNNRSATVESRSNAIDHDYTIELFSEYSNQYHAGGVSALIDGIEGYPNFKTGEWQGYYGTDVVIELDLQEIKKVDSISIGCLQDTKPWILYPSLFSVEFSKDGTSWQESGAAENKVAKDDYLVQTQQLTARTTGKTRYVRLTVKNPGKLPSWHLGSENPCWMFLDEINVHLHE